MRLLLDTHTVFWWMGEKSKLSASATAVIAATATDVFVSVASAWEMSIKIGIGKWPEALPFVNQFERQVAAEHFRLLPITVPHVRMSGLMSATHRDPFDRLLASQALIEGLTIVTADPRIAELGVSVYW